MSLVLEDFIRGIPAPQHLELTALARRASGAMLMRKRIRIMKRTITILMMLMIKSLTRECQQKHVIIICMRQRGCRLRGIVLTSWRGVPTQQASP